MIFKKLFFLPLFLIALGAAAQSTLIPLNNYSYPVLERLQIKSGHYSRTFDNSIKPIARQAAVQFVNHIDSLSGVDAPVHYEHPYWHTLQLSGVDQYHLRKILGDNAEWTPGHEGFLPSRHPLWHTFYKDKANLYAVDVPDFFLAVNPLLRLQAGKESADDKMDYIATRGVELRGLIANKVGFYTRFTENQERPPFFMRNRINQQNAVPGIGYYKNLKSGGYDYLDAAGYITFNVTQYINIQFGYDNNFIGSGYRSLFLSNNAPNYLFLKLNTRIWKLNYTNIFAELTSKYKRHGGDHLLPKKYLTLHRLGIDITPWLNMGVFESIIFARNNHFEFQYLNPIIFYRSIEQAVGSPDNANVGLDAKAIIAHHFELYGQFFLDELRVKEMLSTRGWWGNKWGLQLGAKYVDAFNVKNLDLQGEINIIRPYTYTHGDSLNSYSHYNQALAHPKGANLIEAAALVRYQPLNRLKFLLRITGSQQGLDDEFSDWGGNILINYHDREKDYGNRIGQGLLNDVVNASLTATYELKHNLFVDLSYLTRRTKGAYPRYHHELKNEDSNFFSVGLRWNMGRRDYDF